MHISDPISDMITRIRNAQSAGLKNLLSPHSVFRARVLEVLRDEGYIRGFSEQDVRPGIKNLLVELKYMEGEPVIREIKRVSTPGRRVYAAMGKVKKVANGLGINVLSTSEGVMSDVRARQRGIGGEVLFTVF